mgnify:CR=1 FL=1
MAEASKAIMKCLDKIYQAEMSGISRYLHYSFMIMGHNRIPIQKWFRDNATESMTHAITIGEKITALGGHPSMTVPQVAETKSHSVNDLLIEVLAFEKNTAALYKELVSLAGDDIAIEELARGMVMLETEHIEEVSKMLRTTK